MQVSELLKELGIPEEQVQKEKRRYGTEIRYKDYMMDLRENGVDVYSTIRDSDNLLFNLSFDRKDLIETLRKILQLNTEIC